MAALAKEHVKRDAERLALLEADRKAASDRIGKAARARAQRRSSAGPAEVEADLRRAQLEKVLAEEQEQREEDTLWDTGF